MVNAALTNLRAVDWTNLMFISNQPGLFGTLKYDIRILSDLFPNPSPIVTWTVVIEEQCD